MDNAEVGELPVEKDWIFPLCVFSSLQDDEDGDEAEEESEGGEQDDEMDAQQASASPPANPVNIAGGAA